MSEHLISDHLEDFDARAAVARRRAVGGVLSKEDRMSYIIGPRVTYHLVF